MKSATDSSVAVYRSSSPRPPDFFRTLLEASNESEYADLAVAEIKGIRDADLVIVILPGGRGTHVEIGAALAMGKPVIIHAPNRKVLETPYPCAFHYHPTVKLLFSEQLDVAAVLASISGR